MFEPVVALEIGTSKTVALVGEKREDGGIVITGHGETESTGVRKGEVIDLEQAVAGVRRVLDEAEQASRVDICEVDLVVSGGHIRAMANRGAVPLQGADSEITEDDMEDAMDVARAVALPEDRQVIHTICRDFCIDGQQRVIRPIGMIGALLEVSMLVVHGVRVRIRNTVRTAELTPVDVGDVAFGGLCSALAVLTPEQKKAGVVVIDFGGGTLDYMAYGDGVVAAAGSLGVGGDHVTNDIALACNITHRMAEKLKLEHGSGIVSAGRDADRIKLPAEVGFSGAAVAPRVLQAVIHARLKETFDILRRRLDDQDVLAHVGAGIVLTGGMARLPDITDLLTRVMGLPCTIGKPRQLSGLTAVAENPGYAACAGLVHYAFKTREQNRQRERSMFGALGRMFGKR